MQLSRFPFFIFGNEEALACVRKRRMAYIMKQTSQPKYIQITAVFLRELPHYFSKQRKRFLFNNRSDNVAKMVNSERMDKTIMRRRRIKRFITCLNNTTEALKRLRVNNLPHQIGRYFYIPISRIFEGLGIHAALRIYLEMRVLSAMTF